MGCDIHAFEEWKVNGTWYLAREIEIMRSYELFTRMAGVRQYGDRESIKPISEPRGLPPDVSVMVELHAKHWGRDGHSHSWLSWDEATLLHNEWNEKYPRSHLFYFCYDDPFETGVTGKRIVFWFDN